MVLDTKQKLLIGLTVLLVLTLIYRLATPYRQPTVAKLTYGRTNPVKDKPTNATDGDGVSPPTKIQTTLLTTPPPLEQTIHRDPFRRPPPQTVTRPPEPEPQAPEVRELTPDEQAKKKLGRFKAFGTFSQGERTSLFLQRGKQVLVITVGDRIDGRFTVESIDGRSVLVRASDAPEPFRFEFEELPSDETRPFARSSASGAGLTPSRSPERVAPEASATELPGEDDARETDPGAEEESPPPELPEAPPVYSPAQPFRSSGSPSRSYLPGTKPPDDNRPTAPSSE